MTEPERGVSPAPLQKTAKDTSEVAPHVRPRQGTRRRTSYSRDLTLNVIDWSSERVLVKIDESLTSSDSE